jgi:hypothetical protein
VTGLRAGASFDLLQINNVDNETWSLAGYLSYQATEKLSFHGRAEFFDDYQGQVLYTQVAPNVGAKVMALTGTIQYDLWKNVISRLELRWDHSLGYDQLYGGSAAGSAPELRNAWMLAANVIYKF